ncbi:hypothetical protein MRX96_015371 [Rhipicephalus microplus]
MGVKIVPTVAAATQQLSIQTNPMAVGSQEAAANAPQMSSDMAKQKCRNFFSTLMRLASDQPENTAMNVKRLIQGLVDDTMQPEEFTTKLERELCSNPQPCLIPFLRKSLPLLRHALLTNELSIEGIRPPPRSALCIASPSPPIVHSVQKTSVARACSPSNTVSLHLSVLLLPAAASHQEGGKSLLLARPPNIAAALSPAAGGVLPFKVPAPVSTAAQPKVSLSTSTGSVCAGGAGTSHDKEKRPAGPALIDEDINDVPTMGGVDVDEECQANLSPSDDDVEARSCKDENFLFADALRKRISALAAVHGIDEVPDDVVALVSHATQERLKTFIEKLSVITEHRQENMRCDPAPRGHPRTVARSRAKAEDPEQLELKQRARDLQKAELEEARQREANITALLAIGSRKRPVPLVAPGGGSGKQPFHAQMYRPRVKRVSTRDVLFLMEQERSNFSSEFIYKAYMKY